MNPIPDLVDEPRDQGGFADPRLPTHQNNTTSERIEIAEQAMQPPEFFIPLQKHAASSRNRLSYSLIRRASSLAAAIQAYVTEESIGRR
jgi:hypothetical protein